jgi:hypothetical protein
MTDDIKVFLDKLQEMENTVKVKLVSTGEEVTSKPLSFKQQKNIISTIAEGTIGILKFQKILNDTIIDNVGRDDLPVTDKLPIILKLRAESIGTSLKYSETESIDISENIKKAESMKFSKMKQIKGELTVDLCVPSLKEENKVINTLFEFIKRDGDKEAGKAIGNMYSFEIVKFIERIKIKDTELVFADLPVKDRLKIVENMPLSVNKKIVENIESIKKIENEALDFEVDGETKRIDMDVSFFDN